MKKLTVVTVCILVVFLFLGLLPTHADTEIYDKVLRLHVLANSDSAEDQEVKLKVRDGVLAFASECLADCESVEEAEACLADAKDELSAVAEAILAENGFSYGAAVTLTREEYPRRDYDGLCFPSGEYLSLRVILGEGGGQNWWCVLFPPLCLGAATAKEREDAFIEAGFTAGQYKIITESDKVTYKIKFKCLEWLEKLKADR
ncbi:MAG: stage II sporulation protein R [Ruminococcaceae bacterium]|nr:stage II sporulation protein R [Oscillospiraceae bacterium]